MVNEKIREIKRDIRKYGYLSDEYSNLEELKENYKKFKDKYDLPEFYELNKLFDIEEVDTETDFLLRKIRRALSEKNANYLRFVELILNPSNAPFFFFKLVKKLDSEDMKIINEIHETLGNFEIEMLGLDLDYNEGKEVELIKKIYKTFNENIKIKLLGITQKLGNGKNQEKNNNSSYCG